MKYEEGMPKVSVRLMTYMHFNFISEAIESCLMQKTNFPFEIVIGDDFSTDGTREICLEYQRKFPDLVKVLDRPLHGAYWQTRQKLGRLHNFVDIINNCKGKYIALLDGDDYWTDPLKLQKQFEILENNKDIVVCHHWQTYGVKEGIGWQIIDAPKRGHGYMNQEVGTVKDIFENKLRVKTRTMMFRNIIDDKFFPDWFYKVAFGDVPLNFLLGKHGNYYFINEPLAVYRQTDEGVSTNGLEEFGRKKFYAEHYKNWIVIWDEADKFYEYTYHIQAKETINYFYKIILKNTSIKLNSYFKILLFNVNRNIPLRKSFAHSTLTISYFLKMQKTRVIQKLKGVKS